jgi:ribose transport system substrate-binding protein
MWKGDQSVMVSRVRPFKATRRDIVRAALVAGLTLPEALRASSALAADEKLVVGFSIWDLSIPFAVPLADSLKSMAEQHNIDLRLVAARWDASIQAQDIAEFVVERVDVICATPIDVRAIIPAARAATRARVPFIACLGTVEGYPYIGADDTVYGQHMGKLILQALASSGIKGPYNIAFLRGLPGGAPDRLRREGIMQILASRPDIKIVAEIETDWSPDKGLSGTQDLLQKFGPGKLNLIHGWGGGVEVPGARYAHTVAQRPDVIFTGGELTNQTKEAIQNGWEYGVIIQDPATVGRVIINALPQMAPSFKTVPASAVIPLPVCTKANLSQFVSF